MSRAEVLLWSKLKGKQVAGVKFRRQYGVGPYVVDFYAPSLKFAIEVDGDSHFGGGAEERDRKRQLYLESFGIRCVRFTNEDVFRRLDLVVDEILVAVKRLARD
jgi:very-short-patch-repair endonuclease